jgi:hypothetical protein
VVPWLQSIGGPEGGREPGEGSNYPSSREGNSAELQQGSKNPPQPEDLAGAAIAGVRKFLADLEEYRQQAKPDGKYWQAIGLDVRRMALDLQKQIA